MPKLTNHQYCEHIIHSDQAKVRRMPAHNAAQFIMQMSALGATVEFEFNSQLEVIAKTTDGNFYFVFDSSDDDADLVIDQVL